MKATELRIGNLLNKDGIVVVVDGVTILNFQSELTQCKHYKQIPLTEEWLKKFGFKKAKDGCLYIRYDVGFPDSQGGE